MWGANYVLRVYDDRTGKQESQTGFWGQRTDDDVEALDWLTLQATDWAPQFRVELQKEDDGWTQVLKSIPGSLSCGHDRRSVLGECNDGSWCS